MSNLTASLSLIDDSNNISYSFSNTKRYYQVFNMEKVLDDTDNPSTQSLISLIPGTKGGAQLEDVEFMCIYNKGGGTLEIRIKHSGMEDDSDLDKANTTHGRIAYLLRPGEFMTIPNIWGCHYSSAAQGAANTTVNQMDNAVVSGALSRNVQRVGADILLAEDLDASETGIDVDDGDYFVAGDLLQIGTEIMRVTGISTNTLTVERGVFGSTAASHSDDANLLFPYFNAYHDYDKYVKPQTDQSGHFKCFNFFGRGRTDGTATTYGAAGVCRGSVALKFYEPAYIEFGLSNIRAGDNSGLAANTTYAFDLILNEVVEKGSVTAKGLITFTTDSSNVNWGGAVKGGAGTGVLQKIKNAMDVRFRTVSDALSNLDCDIEIINGDVRFTSHSRLSNSRVGLSVASSGTTVFGNGNFPAVASNEIKCEGKVIGSSTNQVTYGDAARLPDDTIQKDGLTIKNASAFVIDNGYGGLVRGDSVDIGYGGVKMARVGNSENRETDLLLGGANRVSKGLPQGVKGNIDYNTGAIDFTGPPNAEFVVSGMFATAIGTGGGKANNGIIAYVYARSITRKVEGKVQLIAFGTQ